MTISRTTRSKQPRTNLARRNHRIQSCHVQVILLQQVLQSLLQEPPQNVSRRPQPSQPHQLPPLLNPRALDERKSLQLVQYIGERRRSAQLIATKSMSSGPKHTLMRMLLSNGLRRPTGHFNRGDNTHQQNYYQYRKGIQIMASPASVCSFMLKLSSEAGGLLMVLPKG